MVLMHKDFVRILESHLTKEQIEKNIGDIWSHDWGDSKIEEMIEENKGMKEEILFLTKYIRELQSDHKKIIESERDKYLKEKEDLITEKNRLIAEIDARPNITKKEWTKNQREVNKLTNKLEKVRVRCDEVSDLCLKLIDKILAEKGENNSLWKKVERIKLLFETLAALTSVFR